MRKAKNLEIEFLRFVFCIMVILQHSQYVTNKFPSYLNFTTSGHKAIYFFFAVSGFLMVKGYFKNKDFGLTAEKAAWKFNINKMKPIYPDYLFALFIKFTIVLGGAALLGHLTFGTVATKISEIIPDLIGISGGGLKDFFLGVAWYLGAMFVVIPIFYYMLCKNSRFFLYFFAPTIYPFLLALRYNLAASSDSTIKVLNKLIEFPLKAAIGLLTGVLAYLVYKKITEHDYTKFGKFVLTVIELFGYLFILIVSIFTRKISDTFIIPLFIATTAITFSEKSALHGLFKWRIFSFLGKASLPLYFNHGTVFYAIIRLYRDGSYQHNMVIAIPLIILLSAFEYFGVRAIMLMWKKSGIKLIKKDQAEITEQN